jgi:hypothetical protein
MDDILIFLKAFGIPQEAIHLIIILIGGISMGWFLKKKAETICDENKEANDKAMEILANRIEVLEKETVRTGTYQRDMDGLKQDIKEGFINVTARIDALFPLLHGNK